MNRPEIKEIGDYVKELFESLYDWDTGVCPKCKAEFEIKA